MLFSFLPLVAFGTGNALLRYGIGTRCAKQPPAVREAFSEAFGVKNRLLRYGTDIRCAKQAPMVRNEATGCGHCVAGVVLAVPSLAKASKTTPGTATRNGTQNGTRKAIRNNLQEAIRNGIFIYEIKDLS